MMNRRTALKRLTGVASAMLLSRSLTAEDASFLAQTPAQAQAPATPTGPFTLPALPYAYDALEPYIDATTMHLHHDKHHQAYVNNLNAAVAKYPELHTKTVFELVANLNSIPEPIRKAVQNNGGGHANHSLLWLTLGKGGAAPTGELAKAVASTFGTQATLQDKLTTASLSVFGSGFAWLVKNPDGTLGIVTTPNQDSPLTTGKNPLLGIDVWEHAYYLKYNNRRADYLKALFNAINWDYVSSQFASK